MMMENYYKGHNESRFEHSFEQKDNSDSNTLALDLSRKKRVASTLSEVRIIRSNGSSQTLPSAKKQKYQEIRIPFLDENTQTPIADGIIQPIGSSQILPSATKQKYQEIQIPFLNENTQTPIAGSSAMLSPYSASNSPKETKTDSVDYHENSNQLKHTVPLTSTHVTQGVTMATPQQPSLLAFPNEAMNIPVVPKMYLPYIETPQSFITNNEIRRIVSMPAECSTSDTKPSTSSDATKKTPRPFKAYPNNFLTVVNTVDHNSNENYAKFRQMILENIKKVNKNTSNPKMRRVSKSISNPGLPTSTVDEKDAIYWERRKKNNEAAKRSRDARRAKEDELAIRTSFLEYENAQLRMEVQRLKMEAQRHIYIQ